MTFTKSDPASKSVIGRSSLERGKAAERAVASYYRSQGWSGAERTARPGYTTRQRSRADQGDVTGTPGWITQVKAVQVMRPGQLATWLADTRRQAAAASQPLGLLVVKRRGHAHPASWWTYLDLATLIGLASDRPAEALAAVPVCLELAGALALLRWAGYEPAETDPCEVPSDVQEAS